MTRSATEIRTGWEEGAKKIATLSRRNRARRSPITRPTIPLIRTLPWTRLSTRSTRSAPSPAASPAATPTSVYGLSGPKADPPAPPPRANPRRDGDLAHNELPNVFKHLLLTEGEMPLLLEDDQFPEDQRHLVEGPRLDPLRVILEPSVPVGGDLDVLPPEDLHDPGNLRRTDHLA